MKESKPLHSSLYKYLFITALVIFAIGCKSKKLIQHTGPVPERSDTELYQALKDHNYSFDWYACETRISLKNPDEGVSGKAYIRMKKDSIIWSVVKKLSMEVVRNLITENTFAAVNRMDHTYQRGSTSEILARAGISLDFIDLQQAIFGNIVLLDSTSINIEKEGYHYILKGISQDLQLKYWVNAFTLELDRAVIIDYRGRKIDVSYKDYRKLDSGQKVPFHRHYIVPYDDRGDAEIVMKVKKIEIDIPKKTRFSIPANYEKV